MTIRKNWPLVMAIVLPLGMIATVVLSIYIPVLRTPAPTGRFLYRVIYDYVGYDSYIVQDQHLVRRDSIMPSGKIFPQANPPIFHHDIATNQSQLISPEEAVQLVLNPGPSSSEGDQISVGGESIDVFPFFWAENSSDGTVYVKRGQRIKKMNVQIRRLDAHSQFRFLGWVKQ